MQFHRKRGFVESFVETQIYAETHRAITLHVFQHAWVLLCIFLFSHSTFGPFLESHRFDPRLARKFRLYMDFDILTWSIISLLMDPSDYQSTYTV